MQKHFHTDLVFILSAGVAAIVTINVVRFAAAALASKPGVLGSVGKGLGATVHFGS